MAKKDYYETLGVSRGAGDDEIKKAYKKLALKYHPDKNKEEGAEDRFKEINKAYQALSDKQKSQVGEEWDEDDNSPPYYEGDVNGHLYYECERCGNEERWFSGTSTLCSYCRMELGLDLVEDKDEREFEFENERAQYKQEKDGTGWTLLFGLLVLVTVFSMFSEGDAPSQRIYTDRCQRGWDIVPNKSARFWQRNKKEVCCPYYSTYAKDGKCWE